MQQIITVSSPPEAEPVTLPEAKAHLRIDHTDEDDLIRLWIRAAREYAEVHCQRRFVTQTVQVKLDSWPDDDVIRLDGFGAGDVTAVSGITYLDYATGAEQTVATADYQLIAAHQPPLIVLTPTGTAEWPDLEEDRYYPITITLSVGANPPDCPAAVKLGMLMMLAYMDTNRGEDPGDIPEGAKRVFNSAWSGAYA